MTMTFTEIMTMVSRFLNLQLFTLSQTPVTPLSIIVFIAIIASVTIAARIISGKIVGAVLPRLQIEQGLQYTIRRITEYALITVGIIIAFQFVGVNLSGIAVLFGFLSVGIGFGLQNVTSNFVAGLILLFERPVKVGDRITVGDIEGDVSEINIRSTTIRSLNNISIIVPNSEFISTKVINWSHVDPKVRIDINVGVSYGSDIDAVLRSLMEVAAEEKEVLNNPEPDVLFMSFGDSSWDMRLRVWIQDPKRHLQVSSAINCAIVRTFRKNNIEIPFPQRDLHVRSAVPLSLNKE